MVYCPNISENAHGIVVVYYPKISENTHGILPQSISTTVLSDYSWEIFLTKIQMIPRPNHTIPKSYLGEGGRGREGQRMQKIGHKIIYLPKYTSLVLVWWILIRKLSLY